MLSNGSCIYTYAYLAREIYIYIKYGKHEILLCWQLYPLVVTCSSVVWNVLDPMYIVPCGVA